MVILYILNSTVVLIVPVTASAVVPILGLTPHHSYYCHGWLFNRSVVGGVLYITRIPLFWLDDVRCGTRQCGSKCYPTLPLLMFIFVPFFTYDGLVTSQVHPQQHKQPTNTTTMVMETLAPPVAWIWWSHAARVAGGLVHSIFEAAVKGFSWIQKKNNVKINVFVSTSMLNWCWLVRQGQWWSKRHPLLSVDAQNIVID